MAIRTSVAALGSVTMLAVGIVAISTQADISRPTALNSTANGSAEAYNATTGVLEGVTGTAGPGIAYAAVAAVILGALGVLVLTYTGRGR